MSLPGDEDSEKGINGEKGSTTGIAGKTLRKRSKGSKGSSSLRAPQGGIQRPGRKALQEV